MELPPTISENPYISREKPKHRGMLARWGIIPAAIYVATQCTLGFKQAQAFAPNLAVAYTAGVMVGTFLVAIAISCVIYLISGRSHRAGSITFSIVVGIAILGTINLAVGLALRSRPTVGVTTSPEREYFGKFNFEIPAGWIRMPLDRATQKALLLRGNDDWRAADGRIDVIISTPVNRSARELARSMPGGSHLWPEPIRLDGLEAIRADLHGGRLVEPRHGVFVVQGRTAYMILGSQSP